MSEFKVNDRVTWTSHSRRSRTVKTGIVVKVIPPGALSGADDEAFRLNATLRVTEGVFTRRGDSYLVLVEKGPWKAIYWPHTGALKRTA